MYNALTTRETGFRLTFDSKMTLEFASQLEDMIIDALRRYAHVEVDLSRVLEVDLCGINLLGLLKCFSDKGLVIIATSPAVEKAYLRFTPPCVKKPARIATNRTPARTAAGRRSSHAAS